MKSKAKLHRCSVNLSALIIMLRKIPVAVVLAALTSSGLMVSADDPAPGINKSSFVTVPADQMLSELAHISATIDAHWQLINTWSGLGLFTLQPQTR